MLITGSVMHVRWLLDVHTLRYLIRPDRLDVESVRALFPDDPMRDPREHSLRRLLADEIQAPVPDSSTMRYSPHHVLASLIQATLPPCDPKRMAARHETAALRRGP